MACWGYRRGGRRVESEAGYLLLALVWSNCREEGYAGLCVLGKMAVWSWFCEWVAWVWVHWQQLQRDLQAMVGLWQGCWVCGRHEGWQARVWACQKAALELLVAKKPTAVAERRRESRKGAGEEEMASKCTYSALAASGWPGVHERMGSKCRGEVERTGGEPKVAEQPLLHPGRWTLV